MILCNHNKPLGSRVPTASARAFSESPISVSYSPDVFHLSGKADAADAAVIAFLFPQEIVVPLSRGTLMQTPIFYSPYYGDNQNRTPHFRKLPKEKSKVSQQYIIIRTMRTPKMVPLILGNFHMKRPRSRSTIV